MTDIEQYQPPVEYREERTAPSALVEWAEAASAAHRLASPLVTTDFVPAHFRPRGNGEEAVRQAQASATAAILYGCEAGLSPMQSLQSVYVISGKPALYSRAMLAITLSAGHDVWTEESTDTRAIVCGRRRGSRHEERVTVTMDQARKAGWTSNKKYQSEPSAMLLARAQSQVCRRIAPDALLGLPYSAEELEDAEPGPTTTVQRSAPRKVQRKQEPKPEPEPAPEPSLDGDDPLQEFTDAGHEPITAPQMKKLHACLGERGFSRDEGHAYVASVIGRPVDTTKSLSKDEAGRVIDALESAATEPALPIGDES